MTPPRQQGADGQANHSSTGKNPSGSWRRCGSGSVSPAASTSSPRPSARTSTNDDQAHSGGAEYTTDGPTSTPNTPTAITWRCANASMPTPTSLPPRSTTTEHPANQPYN